jgi:hypothetical protein
MGETAITLNFSLKLHWNKVDATILIENKSLRFPGIAAFFEAYEFTFLLDNLDAAFPGTCAQMSVGFLLERRLENFQSSV